jgi:TP901 family phage tail tape measure protein
MADSSLLLKILGDASQLKSELDKAGSHVSGFSEKIGKIGKGMTIAGGIITGVLATIVKKTADVGDSFNDMSLRTGVSVENLSTLAYAAKQSGTTIEGLETGIKFLSKGMYETSKGTGEAKDAFAELGISVVDSEGNLRDTVEVFKEAATKIAAIKSPAEQAALSMKIFGRSGTELIPLLKETGTGITALQGEAKDLNMEISTKSAQAADTYKDAMEKLTGSLAGAGRTIGDVLIPAITPLINKVTEIVGKIALWAEENPKLLETIIKIGATIGVIAAVGGPILMAVSAFTKITGAISMIGTISSGPIGLLILAIGGVYLAWKNWDKIVEYLGGFLDKIKGVFGKVIDFLGGIRDKIVNIVAGIGDKIKGVLEKIGIIGKETSLPGTIKVETPTIPLQFHQEGIAFVPKRAFYGLDPGERVLTAKENINYDQQRNYSPTINIINPVVRNDDDISKIRQEVKRALEEATRQYGRTGYVFAY